MLKEVPCVHQKEKGLFPSGDIINTFKKRSKEIDLAVSKLVSRKIREAKNIIKRE
jgi:2-phosphoglycerate kinase